MLRVERSKYHPIEFRRINKYYGTKKLFFYENLLTLC